MVSPYIPITLSILEINMLSFNKESLKIVNRLSELAKTKLSITC